MAFFLSMVWVVLYWAWIACEVGILVFTRTRRGGGRVQDRGSLVILWCTIFTSVSVGMYLGETHVPSIFGGAHWVRTLSVGVLAVALAIRWTAVLALGRSFSANVAIHATQKVYKAGLFRFVRHPSYSGLILALAAVGLHTRNWISLAILTIPTGAALLYRIHVEEAALREAFGEEYVAYSRVTKRLVPGLY